MQRSLRVVAAWLACVVPASASENTEVTFSKHVAPILWKNCAGCHRTGEVGPFALLDYKDAAKRADFIRDITASRRMPPWKPEAEFGHFRDIRRLSDEEIKTLAKWVETGAKEGDPADLPQMPKYPQGWQLGEPDLVLKMPAPFKLPATGRDVHRCFVIPIPIDSDQVVSAVEFRPGNRRVVHHSIMYLDHTGQGRKKDGLDGQPGYSTFGSPGIVPTGGLGAWAPGVMPRFLPEGIGRFIKKGSDLVLQMHYHPTGKQEETDQSMVGLYFSKKPAEKYVAGIAAASRGLYIPAGVKTHPIVADSEPMPTDVDAWAISPHMHLLGRSMKVTAIQPDKTTIPLIWIKDWDFNWQGTYQFSKQIRLPKGTFFRIEAVYDNSAENPNNPHTPPQPVRWGEQTTDEMCLCVIQVTTDTMDDMKKVAALRGARLGSAIDGGLPPEFFPRLEAGPVVFPPGGIPIPDRLKDVLGQYDKNKDSKLSQEEVESMPPPLRDQVKEALQRLRISGNTTEKN